MKRAKAEAKEEAPAPQAVKKPNTAKNTKANVQDDEVISLPPIITDYSGRRFEETPRSDYDNVTVGDMLDDEGSLEIAGHTSKPNAEREIAVPAFLKWANLHKSKDKSAENQPVAVHSINEAVAPEVTEEKGIGTGDGEINVPQAGQYAQYEQTVKMTDYAANAEVTSEGNAETDVALANEAENKNSAENFREAAPTSYVAEAEPAAESAAAKSAGDEAHKVKSENAAPVRTELKRVVNYQLPPLSLMKGGITVKNSRINQKIMDDSVALENVLASFGVKTKVVEVVCGPAIIRYELQPAPGVKISKIVSLADDIALALAARGLRIEAPVPGKSVVGIEVAREETSPVYFKDVLNSEKFQRSKSKISIAFGMDINGGAVVGNLAEMPHLLIAGATGSGKSVCMNTLICSILYKAKPDEVKFIMVDPKKVEMTAYVGLPHLGRPVVTDAKKASQVLKEVVSEMDRRYLVFVNAGVKNFAAYNELPDVEKMPQIVVLIDELADLMMVASRDVEDSIVRLTQLARAAGIHLVIATQRPSVDVITGLIKANVPSRIAFAVSSQIDSRTILDMGGAEKLLGKGDMLYFPIGQQKPLRVQGAFLTEEEIHDLVAYCKQQAEPEYLELPLPDEAAEESEQEKEQQDELFIDACQQVISSGQASASSLQRRFRIGYNRAARLIETMQDLGIVSAPEGNKRTVLMNMPTFAATYLRSPEETSAANAAAEADNSGNAPEGNVEAAAENVEQSEDVFGENMRNENQG
jgi:S-DNA-T family DNA segregation ATPase FtsK/SpoIIIE